MPVSDFLPSTAVNYAAQMPVSALYGSTGGQMPTGSTGVQRPMGSTGALTPASAL